MNRCKNKQERMKVNMKKSLVIVISILLLLIGVMSYVQYVENETIETLSRYGSSGEEVKQIQKRLKEWGYYNGAVDGIYGSKTQQAVKKFQKANGLTQDGIAGEKTLAAIGISSSGGNKGQSTSSNSSDLNLLSRLVYGEARGEQYIGQVAVAAVVLNRVSSSKFPNTVAGVIYQKGAFDVVSDGQINLSPNSTAKSAAQDALNGWDPSNGALYYFNPNTATSSWIWSRKITLTIGSHMFCI